LKKREKGEALASSWLEEEGKARSTICPQRKENPKKGGGGGPPVVSSKGGPHAGLGIKGKRERMTPLSGKKYVSFREKKTFAELDGKGRKRRSLQEKEKRFPFAKKRKKEALKRGGGKGGEQRKGGPLPTIVILPILAYGREKGRGDDLG